MHKIPLKFAPVVELAKLRFTYNHSTEIAKAGPGFDEIHKKLWKSLKLKMVWVPFRPDKF